MRTITIISIILLAAIGWMCTHQLPAEPVYNVANDVNSFHVGDTLLPDYAHSDTLVVVDADSLNYLFDGVDATILPTTDSEIDSVLHLYCHSIKHHCNWLGCDYKGLTELPIEYNPIDSIHFNHPEWDYDKCESLINDHIIEQDTDERGFTSVVFTQGKDTFGLDYLDKHELDSLKSTFKQQ